MKCLIFLFTFLITGSGNYQTAEWGKTGHRVVGAIAEDYLNEEAKKAVNRILGYESMAIASIWMDQIRSNQKFDYTNPWHYVTIPPGMK